MRNPTKRGPMILVTGATGGVGRHFVSGLLAEGFTVRAMSRDPDTARLPPGGDVVRGDLADAASLAAALAGVESVFLLWPFFNAEGAGAVVDAKRRNTGAGRTC